VRSPAVKALLESLSSDILLEITVGAVLGVVSYSSLAIVLLTATLAASGAIPLDVALGLTLGCQPGQRPAGRAGHGEVHRRSPAGAHRQPGVQVRRAC
jgi:Na+/phosphate symporter